MLVRLFPKLHGTLDGIQTRSPPASAGGFYGIRCIREGLPVSRIHAKHDIVQSCSARHVLSPVAASFQLVRELIPPRGGKFPTCPGVDAAAACCHQSAGCGMLVARGFCYVVYRGYAKFTLWNAIVAAKSSYVCRIRDNAAPTIEWTNELSDADRAAGILSDEDVESRIVKPPISA